MTESFKISIEDHTKEVIKAKDAAIASALEKIGITVENHAVDNIRAAGREDTGALSGSIKHETKKDSVIVGSNLEYAIYNEYGTGVYGEKSTGSGWWVYVTGGGKSGSHAKGKRYSETEARRVVAILRSKGLDAHMTQGMKPIHFLKNAVANHMNEYKQIVEQELKNA